MRNSNAAVNGNNLLLKAADYAKKFPEEGAKFKFSNGWLEGFKKRHNTVARTLSGEANSVDINVVSDYRDSVIPDLLRRYVIRNMYNTDEGAMNIGATSNKTLTYLWNAH